jgi:hypothetical protein
MAFEFLRVFTSKQHRPSGGRLAVECSAVILIGCIGFFGYLMHTTNWLNAIPGDYSDARFNSVVLEHFYLWLQGAIPTLWSPNYFYPFQHVLGFSDNHFGSGWVYALFRAFSVDREGAYLGWFLIGNCLNYLACFYVCHRLGFSLFASAAGAFVYAFGLPALLQEAHAQLNYRFAVPLAFASFTRYLNIKNTKDLAHTLLWVTIQFYCTIYIGVFLVYLLLAVLISTLLIERKAFFKLSKSTRQTGPSYQLRNVALMVLGAGAVLLLLGQYYRINSMYAFDSTDIETTYMLPRLSSYLLADRVEPSRWLGWWAAGDFPSAYRHEHQLFLGFGVWGLVLIAGVSVWWLRPSRFGRIVCLSLLLIVVLTLDIAGHSLYWLFFKIPGVSAIRSVSRIGLVLLLPIAIMVAIAIDYFVKSEWYPVRRYRLPLLVLAIVALTYETSHYQPYHYPVQAWRDRQERLQSLIQPALASDAILYVTNAKADPWDTVAEVDAMIYAQDRRLPTLNGYSGRTPPRFRPNHPCISVESRLQSYFDFARTDLAQQADYLKRVRVISPEQCPHPPGLVATKQFDPVNANAIQLSVTAEILDKAAAVHLAILNKSVEPLHAVSKHWPIRLSWRFVPLKTQDSERQQISWEARRDLYFSIAGEQTHLEHFNIPLPENAENYVLEFSLVQEGHYWFHERGMPIAALKITRTAP